MFVQIASMNARSCDTTITVSSASPSQSWSQVEVVGGPSEQQQVGGRDELRREAHAPPLAARQRRHEPRLRLLGVEAESLEHGVNAGVIDVAPEVGETLLVVPEPFEEILCDLFP